MPDLFYGPYRNRREPMLYTPGMQPIHTGIFSRYEIDGLAPRHKKRHVAHFWHWCERKHSILSWHDLEVSKHEFTVFVPSLLPIVDVLEYARHQYPEVMPSPITFRIHQHFDEVLLYDD